MNQEQMREHTIQCFKQERHHTYVFNMSHAFLVSVSHAFLIQTWWLYPSKYEVHNIFFLFFLLQDPLVQATLIHVSTFKRKDLSKFLKAILNFLLDKTFKRDWYKHSHSPLPTKILRVNQPKFFVMIKTCIQIGISQLWAIYHIYLYFLTNVDLTYLVLLLLFPCFSSCSRNTIFYFFILKMMIL